jgi:arsenate reductase-like glutaredoxin family protein
LRNAGVEFEAVDYAKKPLDEATVRSIIKAAGSVGDVINARHAIAKEKGWAEAPPDADTFAKAVAKDVNLLRRPIVVAGAQAIVGFDKAAYAKLGG